MHKELEGKTALVTGGSRGLGREIAMRLAEAGALVVINFSSDEAAAAETVTRIEHAGGRAFALQAKLGGFAAAESLASSLDMRLQQAGFTGLDILINNVGGATYGTIVDMDEVRYDMTMESNVRAAFFTTKALYSRLNDCGRVINVSSISSRLTIPGIIVYTMAKAAIEAFTRVLAQDLGARGITVNSISPGFTVGDTNVHILKDPERAKRVTEATALGRYGEPTDVADMVYALASPLSRWVTGQNIEVTGGFRDISAVPLRKKAGG